MEEGSNQKLIGANKVILLQVTAVKVVDKTK
jgi:hypothetical protein